MKTILLIACSFIVCTTTMDAQSVGINTTTPDNTAILDVKSNVKGMLLPRTSTTSRLAIANPAKGLMLYDTTASAFYFYNGSVWAPLSAGSNGWSLTGNAGINTATNFIGTTDDNALRFKIKNLNAGLLDSTTNSTAFGFRAMDSITVLASQFNAAFGYKTLTNNITGIQNTATGGNALRNNKTGSYNTANGYGSLISNTTGNYNTANGGFALTSNTAGEYNLASGLSSLFSNTTGNKNTATGSFALYLNTIGSFNTANGVDALHSNTIGNENTATGIFSLYTNFEGNYNSAYGSYSLANNTNGYNNTGVGDSALYFNTFGDNNTAIGFKAMANNAGGRYNNALGSGALVSNTSGSYNTAIGNDALSNKTVGNNNTAIGEGSLQNLIGGSNNIAIGYHAGNALGSPNVINTISIGNDGFLNGANNQVFIGNLSTTYCGTHVSWATFSDARIKTGIAEEVKGLDFINRLRPVTYFKNIRAMTTLTGNKETADFEGKYDIEKIKFSGFLAQEVEQAAIESGYDFSGLYTPQSKNDLYALSYETFVVPLVKAVQEQQIIITKLQKQIELLEKRVAIVVEKK